MKVSLQSVSRDYNLRQIVVCDSLAECERRGPLSLLQGDDSFGTHTTDPAGNIVNLLTESMLFPISDLAEHEGALSEAVRRFSRAGIENGVLFEILIVTIGGVIVSDTIPILSLH